MAAQLGSTHMLLWRPLSRRLSLSRRLLQKPRSVHHVRWVSAACVMWSKIEPIPLPQPDGEPKQYSNKIRTLVEEISSLTLSETAELSELLKTTLNISEAPVVMPTSAAAASPQEKAEEPVEEQTEFTVNLVQFAPDSKVKLIKEVKTLVEGLNLVQAKRFVEEVPQVVKKDVSKEEAEKLKATLEAVGGVVEIK